MSKINMIYKIINRIFLIIPVLLFILSLSLSVIYGFRPETSEIKQLIWKPFWHLAYYFYLALAFVVFFFWLKLGGKNIGGFLASYRNWFIGFVLSMFSFALAGLITDIIFILIMLSIGKAPTI